MKTYKVTLTGLTPIMFDCFRGQEEIPPERKLYVSSKDGKTLILPSANIMGFLASQTSVSCLKTYVPVKEKKAVAAKLLASIAISPDEIPFVDERGPILFEDWNEQVRLDERMARPSATARVVAKRPVLNAPWKLTFELFINEGDYITGERIKDWFLRGGFEVGVGAYRPLFGRFTAELDEV